MLFFELSLDMLCIANFEGYFVQLNPAWERTLGWSVEELTATPFIEFVHPEDRDATMAEAARLMPGAQTVAFENRYRCKDGSYKWLLWTSIGLPERGLLLAVARDMTERHEAEEAVLASREEAERARLQAERASVAKSEFLSRMSHELRTPLNAILGFAQLLEMSELGADQREGVHHILKGGNHLLELINEVLDIARIEAGRLPLSLEAVHVIEVVEEAHSLIAPLAAARGIRIAVVAPGEEHVLADRQRLKQVLLNLLSNAVKYNAERGDVVVEVARAPGDALEVSISDTGPGISPEHMHRLFEPFDRLAADESQEGTGLGLALSKRLVEAMGGTIGCESEPGTGTTFRVRLAVTDAPASKLDVLVEQGQPDPGLAIGRWTVLSIEDNPSNVRLVERILRHRPGVELIGAMQGRLGLDLARRHLPDVILLDLNLPDVSGLSVLEALRADPVTSAIPVVVLSADATKGQIDRLLRAGAHAYLTKPLAVQRFLQTLDAVLEVAQPADPEAEGSYP